MASATDYKSAANLHASRGAATTCFYDSAASYGRDHRLLKPALSRTRIESQATVYDCEARRLKVALMATAPCARILHMPYSPGPSPDTDPLGDRGRNEPCWCGSGRKYKACHGDHLPASTPGAPLPPDEGDELYLTPNTRIATSVLLQSMPAGTPFHMPAGEPAPAGVSFTNWDQALAGAQLIDDSPMTIVDLGRLRVEVLTEMAALPESSDAADDDLLQGYFDLAAQTLFTVSKLAQAHPRRTILWNAELDVAEFLGKTLLLADHVLYPDSVFGIMLRGATKGDVRQAALGQLAHRSLLNAGIAIPVPERVAMAAHGNVAVDLTARDLRSSSLVDWVRRQLVFEGPTAREALFVRARDDLALTSDKFWLHGRIARDSVNSDDRTFRTAMLQDYDPAYDYRPWLKQVSDEAVSQYVQRTNERFVSANVFGAEYVSASLFEARLLQQRPDPRSSMKAPQAAMWANIPLLGDLKSPDLAKLLSNETAVEDLRSEVRASMAIARTDADRVDALTHLAHEVSTASQRIVRASESQRLWQGVLPTGFGVASMVVGGITGGIPAIIGGGLAVLGGLAPYLGGRLEQRQSAAYLFVTARRRLRR